MDWEFDSISYVIGVGIGGICTVIGFTWDRIRGTAPRAEKE